MGWYDTWKEGATNIAEDTFSVAYDAGSNIASGTAAVATGTAGGLWYLGETAGHGTTALYHSEAIRQGWGDAEEHERAKQYHLEQGKESGEDALKSSAYALGGVVNTVTGLGQGIALPTMATADLAALTLYSGADSVKQQVGLSDDTAEGLKDYEGITHHMKGQPFELVTPLQEEYPWLAFGVEAVVSPKWKVAVVIQGTELALETWFRKANGRDPTSADDPEEFLTYLKNAEMLSNRRKGEDELRISLGDQVVDEPNWEDRPSPSSFAGSMIEVEDELGYRHFLHDDEYAHSNERMRHWQNYGGRYTRLQARYHEWRQLYPNRSQDYDRVMAEISRRINGDLGSGNQLRAALESAEVLFGL